MEAKELQWLHERYAAAAKRPGHAVTPAVVNRIIQKRTESRDRETVSINQQVADAKLHVDPLKDFMARHDPEREIDRVRRLWKSQPTQLERDLDMPYVNQTWSRFKGKTRDVCRQKCPVAYLIKTIDGDGLAENVSSKGYRISAKMFDILARTVVDELGNGRTEVQAKLHKALHTSFVPVIHSIDYDQNSRSIHEYYNIKGEIKPFTFIEWPRRTGKSLSTMMFCAALGLTLGRKAVFGLISTGRTAVIELLKYVRDFGAQFADECNLKVRTAMSASRPCVVFIPKTGDVTQSVTFMGLPKGTDNNRGYTKFDGLFVDEAAFVPRDVFIKVVLPPLRLFSTVGAFLSSTSNDENNPFSQFKTVVDRNGELLFNIVELDLVCPRCRAQNLKTCVHRQHMFPHWFSDKRTDDLMRIAEKVDPEAVRVEFFGDVESTIQYVFSKALVDKFLKTPRVNVVYSPTVYIYWDPSGGGGSMSAGVSAYIDENMRLVVSGVLYYKNTSSSSFSAIVFGSVVGGLSLGALHILGSSSRLSSNAFKSNGLFRCRASSSSSSYLS